DGNHGDDVCQYFGSLALDDGTPTPNRGSHDDAAPLQPALRQPAIPLPFLQESFLYFSLVSRPDHLGVGFEIRGNQTITPAVHILRQVVSHRIDVGDGRSLQKAFGNTTHLFR